jgi:hypothetical protein
MDKKLMFQNYLRKFFERNKIPYQYDSSSDAFILISSDACGDLFHVFTLTDRDITLFSLFSWEVPTEKIPAVNSYFGIINSGLKMGSFSIDSSTRCIAYQVEYNCASPSVDEEAFSVFIDRALIIGANHQEYFLRLAGVSPTAGHYIDQLQYQN